MMLTDLDVAVAKSGLRYETLPGWKTAGHAQMKGVRTITAHHTAGPRTGDRPSLNVVRYGRPDLAGPLAQIFLTRAGVPIIVAAGLCWHAGASRDPSMTNDYSIGIEAEATGVDAWPAAMVNAYAQLCAGLCEHYNLTTARVMGHKETCSPPGRKSDPNFDMPTFRALVQKMRSNHTEGKPMALTDSQKLDLLLNQMVTGQGTADNGASWGWDSWVAGSKRKTVVDYLRDIESRLARLESK